ncbi:hypothetical protein E2542_SST02707 [Spatholobus suberectus]|nr:hypothetical protein E2542_SST02707 [Spatholobus suberectus]
MKSFILISSSLTTTVSLLCETLRTSPSTITLSLCLNDVSAILLTRLRCISIELRSALVHSTSAALPVTSVPLLRDLHFTAVKLSHESLQGTQAPWISASGRKNTESTLPRCTHPTHQTETPNRNDAVRSKHRLRALALRRRTMSSEDITLVPDQRIENGLSSPLVFQDDPLRFNCPTPQRRVGDPGPKTRELGPFIDEKMFIDRDRFFAAQGPEFRRGGNVYADCSARREPPDARNWSANGSAATPSEDDES